MVDPSPLVPSRVRTRPVFEDGHSVLGDVQEVAIELAKVDVGVRDIAGDVGEVVIGSPGFAEYLRDIVDDVWKVGRDVGNIVDDVREVANDVGAVVNDIRKVAIDLAEVVVDVWDIVSDVREVVIDVPDIAGYLLDIAQYVWEVVRDVWNIAIDLWNIVDDVWDIAVHLSDVAILRHLEAISRRNVLVCIPFIHPHVFRMPIRLRFEMGYRAGRAHKKPDAAQSKRTARWRPSVRSAQDSVGTPRGLEESPVPLTIHPQWFNSLPNMPSVSQRYRVFSSAASR